MVDIPINPSNRIQPTGLERQKIQVQSKLANRSLARSSSARMFQHWCESGFNPVTIRREFKSLEEIKSKKGQKEVVKEEEQEASKIQEIKKVDETATRYHKENSDLSKKLLLVLRNLLKESDTSEDILKKVLQFYSDPTLADEALDFLIETTAGKLCQECIKAKNELNKLFEREIKAGKNIKAETQDFSKKGFGTQSDLRFLYRDITGTVRTTQTLFEELAQKYNFDQLKTVLKFLFNALGADFRSKGPSISSAELQKLIDDTKSLQAIYQLYKFFLDKMGTIHRQFINNNLPINPNINFELLAKQFMELLNARYVSSEKILQMAKVLGISEELLAEIIIFTTMRDAIRKTSLKLYRSNKHRQEILDAFIETLEDLEEKLDEEEEEKK